MLLREVLMNLRANRRRRPFTSSQVYILVAMKLDKRFAQNLRAVLSAENSQELIVTPPFLEYLKFESKKRKIDPNLFFTRNKWFMDKLKK